jgi:protein-tyrosine phosphatase
VVELRVPLIDKKGAQVDIELVQEAVKWVVDKHKDNKKVLVRCHAGLNRSGLIVVPVLTFIEPSLSFNDALQRVRTLRHKLVLNRPEFLEVAKKVARAGS